jgi:lipid-A-disaccharide synthase
MASIPSTRKEPVKASEANPKAARPAVKHDTAIVFTAFEPSGDAHAAPVIRELLRRAPHMKIYAWGGPRMQEAGATIVELTCGDGTMGAAAAASPATIIGFQRMIGRVKRWSRAYRVLLHVPVDSPAVNFPICKIMRKAGVRVVHLVAPQVWAWGRWRVPKLRRLTDLVLCLLPFEDEWFERRKIPAKFIGHPSINRQLDEAAISERVQGLPQGSPRIAMFPGSRSHEVRRNMRLMSRAFAELQDRHHGMVGLIVAANPERARQIRKLVNVFPTGLHMITGSVDAAIAWCDLALAVSGTISLDIARQRKPMVAVYKTGMVSWLGSKLLLRTPYCLLPNIVAGREIVPEFVPHAGGAMPIVNAATRILSDSKHAAVQSEELSRVCARFANHFPDREAAAHILEVLRSGSAR